MTRESRYGATEAKIFVMQSRNEKLQRFIAATEGAIQARVADSTEAMPMVERIVAALQKPGEANLKPSPSRLPICRHLEAAYHQARSGPGPIPKMAEAFAAIEPAFSWDRRQSTAQATDEFYDGHANAYIVGKGGLESRSDVLIGVSLVAPGVLYPRHRHPPEELYIVLSPGEWMQNDNPMTPRQSGDLVHNPPNVWHGMRADKAPLLAVWCLC